MHGTSSDLVVTCCVPILLHLKFRRVGIRTTASSRGKRPRIRRSRPLEDNSHSRAEKSRCVSPGCVGGMDGNLYIRPNLDTLRQTQAIKQLKHALMVLSRDVRFTVIECGAEHVSPASEWMNLSQPESVFIFNGRSGLGREGKYSEWRPTIRQFMVELKTTAISTPAILSIVSPDTRAKKPILFTK